MRYAGLSMCLLAGTMVIQSGCAVPQRPGNGQVRRIVEPTTKAGYWLYLPGQYVSREGRRADGERWPLVVTFHGTQPFDAAHLQIREWQEEADRYGFVVVAPELATCNCLMQFPLRDATLSYVQRDERATLAIMDDVCLRNRCDPDRVLSTGWSTGGYLAHYMVNRHPDRFNCLAVRESTFSESMLDPTRTDHYRNMRIAVFFGENDFRVCRRDSRLAVAYYRKHGFSVEAESVAGLGHQRIPQAAAAFYASGLGLTPASPPPVIHLLKEANREG